MVTPRPSPTVTTLPSATTTTVAAHPTIQEGSTGADVTVLQQRLNALGYDVGTADGTFGPGTKEQVIKFQTDKGITPADGVVNAATWNALLAEPELDRRHHDHRGQVVLRRADAAPVGRAPGFVVDVGCAVGRRRRRGSVDGRGAGEHEIGVDPEVVRPRHTRRPGGAHREVIGEGMGHRTGSFEHGVALPAGGRVLGRGLEVVAHDRSSLQVPMNDCKEPM